MIRAVLDSNIIESGVGWGGPPGAVGEAALADRGGVIVTGDQDLLTLAHVDQIKILTPRDFLEMLQSST